MKNLLFISFMLLPLLSHAAGNLLENKEVRATVIETTNHLKHEFSKELKQSIGIEEFTLHVEIKVDEKELQDNLRENKQNWSKFENLSLPGLFVEGNEGYANPSFRQARKEDILIALNEIKINLIYHQKNYKPEFLTTTLKNIVSFNIPQLKEGQINILPELKAAPYQVAAETMNVKLTSEFSKFWDAYYKFILGGSALILLVTGFILAFTLKGGLGSLSDVIKAKTFTNTNNAARENAAPKVDNTHNEHLSSEGDKFESYVQANEYLTSMVAKEPKIFNEVIILKLMAGDFVSVTILLDVLAKDKRDVFLANIDQDKKDRFKEFIVGQGTSVLKDEVLLKEQAIKMIKLVKIAALSPNELYQIVITDMVTGLSIQDLGVFLKSALAHEKSFVCELLDANKMAFLVQNEILSPLDIDTDVPQLTQSEMVDFLIKASSINGFKKTQIRKDKLESVYAQVETDKAEVLADAMGLEPQLRFEYLFTTFQDHGLKYLEAMDFENLALLFPLMTEGMRKEVLASLPELLSERLRFAKKKINAESLKLKGDFYFHLRSLSSDEEGTADSGLKLVA